MNQSHDQNLSQTGEDEALKVVRWGRWILAIVMIVLIGLMSFGWFLRKGFAERAMQNWCAGKDLQCSAHFETLDANGATLSDIVVRSETGVPFEAEEVTAKLDWVGLLTPKLVDLSVTEPVLRGTFQNGRVTLHGLENLITGGSGGGGRVPHVSITNGRVLITTDAGDITATANVEGRLPENGTLNLQLDPADLKGPGGEINWQAGDVNLTAENGQLFGTVHLDMETAELNDLKFDGAKLDADIRSDSKLSQVTIVKLHSEIASANWPSGDLKSVSFDATGDLSRLPKANTEDFLSALSKLAFDAKGEAVQAGAYAAGPFTAGGAFERDARGLSGPAELHATDVEAPQGRVETLAFKGDVFVPEDGGWNIGGQVDAQAVAVSESLSTPTMAKLNLPGVLAAHGNSLKGSVGKALQGFSTTADIRLRRQDDTTQIAVEGPLDISARSGLKLSVSPEAGTPAFRFKDGNIAISGKLRLSGGGAPSLSADLQQARIGKAFELEASSIVLAPWAASGKSFAGRLQTLALHPADGGLNLTAKGVVDLSGAFPGIQLDQTRLSGSLSGQSGENGWTVLSTNRCLDMTTNGFEAGGLRVGQMRLPVCPEGRKIYHQGGGALTLGALSVPFSIGESSKGVLALENSRLDWSAKRGVSLTLRGETTHLPLEIGERTLDVKSTSLQMGMIAGNGPLRLSLRAEAPTFEGTLVPANVIGDSVRFDGSVPEGGVSGTLVADRLVFTDKHDDPIFQPLTSDINADLSKGRLEFIAPVRLKRGGISVADAKVDIDIVKLDGVATVNTRPLSFKPGGLQPHMLSDRLRGLFTEAVGDIEGQASLLATSGKLFGTGRVSVQDFGFQTQRLGRVQNVDGEVVFTDLLGLTTAPNQTVSVGELNPGIPLTNGRLQFQFIGGKRLHLASGSFPFGGGKLAMTDMDWMLGADQQAFSVDAQGLKLDQLIEVFKLPDIKATGTVSGALPIRINGNEILVEEARLKADETGGFLSYTGDVGDKADAAGEYGKMAFDALKKLDYSVLEVGVNGNLLGDITVDLLMRGKSTEVLNGQPFEYDISINSKLAQLLQSRLYYSGQDWLSDVKTDTLPGGGKVERVDE